MSPLTGTAPAVLEKSQKLLQSNPNVISAGVAVVSPKVAEGVVYYEVRDVLN